MPGIKSSLLAGFGPLLLASVSLVASPAEARSAGQNWQDLPSLNLALKKDPLNAHLNFLAALAYESSSVIGTERREVAKAGYSMALKGSPAFWPAHVQLGLMALEERDSLAAQKHFISAALLNPDEPVIYYGLARAAFCAGDLALAQAAFARASGLRPPVTEDELTTAAAIHAKAGDAAGARAFLAQMPGTPVAPMVIQAISSPSLPEPAADVPIMQPDDGADSASFDRKMGMVDIIILRRDESKSSVNGINLLEALSLQLGSSLVNSRWSTNRDRISNMVTSSTQDITRELTATIPSVTYSLNIANARDGWSTVQAQQALLIYDGELSKVSVGSSLTYATDGDLSSTVATKEDGLTLQIKPAFLAEGSVKLTVSANLEDFVPGAPAGSFRQSVQTERSSTDVTAELRFGETILIASGESAINSQGGNKTPLLGSLPVLGQLFRRDTSSKLSTSVLILLTLRPRGGERLPHLNEIERREFEQKKDRLLKQLDASGANHFHKFIPDTKALSYQLHNPARVGDKSYLAKIGVLQSIATQ